MSELGDKFATARFGLKKEAQPISYGPQVDPRYARKLYEIVQYRIPRLTRQTREAARYMQQLQQAPPKEVAAPSMLAGGAGVLGAAALRPRGIGSVLSQIAPKDFLGELGYALGGTEEAKTLAKTLQSKLGRPGVSKLLSREGLSRVPIIGRISRWFPAPKVPAGVEAMLAKPGVKASLGEAAKHFTRRIPWRGTLLKGGLAGLGLLYARPAFKWLWNRIKYGPGGAAKAEAAQALQEKLRSLERDLAYLSTGAAEMRRARAARERPRLLPWGPFSEYVQHGRPLQIPMPPPPR